MSPRKKHKKHFVLNRTTGLLREVRWEPEERRRAPRKKSVAKLSDENNQQPETRWSIPQTDWRDYH